MKKERAKEPNGVFKVLDNVLKVVRSARAASDSQPSSPITPSEGADLDTERTDLPTESVKESSFNIRALQV